MGGDKMHILIAEDEQDLNRILKRKLEEEHYVVDSCYDGKSALEYLLLAEYDGAILDIMLPEMNGFDILKEIRKNGVQTPVMFLTALSDTKDIVRGLDEGADDYMVKPFEFSELLARLRVLLRKHNTINENIYRCGDLEVDVNKQLVKRGGKVIEVSPKEFSVLLYLIRNQNIVVSRQQIESNVWNIDHDISSNVVDVYIRFLRRKIDEGFEDKIIQTIRGVGYVLKCEK